MEFFQIGEKALADGVFNIGDLQAGSQTLEQIRHDRGQLAALFRRMFGFDAPDKQIHGDERVLPGIAALAAPDMDYQQRLDPLVDEKLDHRTGQFTNLYASLDLKLCHGLGSGEAFFQFDSLRGGPRLLLGAPIFFVEENRQPLAHGVEDIDVVLEVIHQFLDDALQASKQRVGRIKVARQARRNFAERIQQPPGRMSFLGEELLVRDRDLEHRDLHPADEPLYRNGDLGIIEKLVEQHGDDIERHAVQLVHAATHTGGFQFAKDICR